MENVLEFVDKEGGAPLILTLEYILDSLNFWFKTQETLWNQIHSVIYS